MKIKQITGMILQVIACVLGASCVLFGLWVFLINRYDGVTGMWFDVFGRQLHESIGFMGRDLSPGFMWEIIDTAIVISLFALVATLFSWGKKLGKVKEKNSRLIPYPDEVPPKERWWKKNIDKD